MGSRGAIAGLVAALVAAATLRWTSPERVADLRPRPDALEYEEAARSLIEGDGYALRIGSDVFPPRYPPGFSILLAPAIATAPHRPGVGIHVVLLAALAAIAGAWRLAGIANGPRAAVAAAVLLAFSPLHVRWSRAVMSDVPTSAALAWLGVWVLLLLRRSTAGGIATAPSSPMRPSPSHGEASSPEHRGHGERLGGWLALGAAVGLAASVRSTVLLFVPVVVGVLFVDARAAGIRSCLARAAALAMGGALGLAPLLAWNVCLFGSPLRSGYEYWAPGSYFGASALLDPVAGGEVGNAPFYLASLAGLGRLYPWPIALLVALGFVRLLRSPGDGRRLALLALGLVVALLAVQLPFFWQAERYLLPVLPLLCAVAGAPFAAERATTRGVAVALALTAGVLVARTSEPYAPPDRERFDARTLAAIDSIAEDNAAIVARTNPLLFDRLLRGRGDRVWVPLGLDEHRAKARRFAREPIRSGPPEEGRWLREAIPAPFAYENVGAAVAELLAEGRPVYLSTQMRHEVPAMDAMLAGLARTYDLEPVAHVGNAEVFRLRKHP